MEPPGCVAFRAGIFDYQAEELPEPEREAFDAHREACPPCAQRLAAEDAILRALRSSLGREHPPADLAARVRRALRREAPDPGPRAWRSALRWAVPLAATLGLAAILAPVLEHTAEDGSAGVIAVDEPMVLVDRDCDSAGRGPEEQRACNHPRHLNALKAADGRYWSPSLDPPAMRALLVDRRLRGHVLRVRGEGYPRIHTLRVAAFEDLGPALSASLRPRDP
jgi:hypothetical protein